MKKFNFNLIISLVIIFVFNILMVKSQPILNIGEIERNYIGVEQSDISAMENNSDVCFPLAVINEIGQNFQMPSCANSPIPGCESVSEWQNSIAIINFNHCDVKVLYKFRKCISANNYSQIQVLGFYYKNNNSACNDLNVWLNDVSLSLDKKNIRLNYFLDQLQQLVAENLFVKDNEAVKAQGKQLYCDEEPSAQYKVEAKNYACRSMCIGYKTVLIGDIFYEYSVVKFQNCTQEYCCTITYKSCINRSTNKMETTIITSSDLPESVNCGLSPMPTSNCPPSTISAQFPCESACAIVFRENSETVRTSFVIRDIFVGLHDIEVSRRAVNSPNYKKSENINSRSINDGKIKFYPNPANEILYFEYNDEFAKIEKITIRDILGDIKYEYVSDKNFDHIDVTRLTSGIYSIIISTDKGSFKEFINIIK